MSALEYAAGGLGQGLVQGKQFQYQRQTKNRELANEEARTGLEQQAQTNAVQQAHRVMVKSTLDDIRTRLQEPNANLLYPDQLPVLHQKYISILRANPDMDYAGEVAAEDARNAGTQQAGNAVDANILAGPTGGMNPSVSGQPSAPPTAQPTATPQPSTPPAPPSGGEQPTAGAQTPPPMPVMMSSAQPQAQQPDNSGQFPNANYEQRTGGTDSPFNAQADAIDERIRTDPTLTPDQKDHLHATSLGYRLQGIQAGETLARGNLATAQTAGLQAALPSVGPQAQATLGLTKAQTSLAGNEASQVVPNAQMQRAGTKEQIASSQYQRGTVIPTQLGQEQQKINLQKSAQNITKILGLGNIDIQQKQLGLELGRLGMSADQFHLEQLKVAHQMGLDTARLKIEMGTPGFNQKVLQQAVLDGAISVDKLGQKHWNGATAGQASNVMNGGVVGQQQQVPAAQPQPAAAAQQQPAGFHSVLGNNLDAVYHALLDKNGNPDKVKINNYLSSSGYSNDSAATKVAVLNYMGLIVPDRLKQAAAQESGAGFRQPRR